MEATAGVTDLKKATLCVIFVANLPDVHGNALCFLSHETQIPSKLCGQDTLQVNLRVT